MKKAFSLILSVLMILSTFSILTVSAQETEETFSDVMWHYNSDDNTLTISGDGYMPNYSYQVDSDDVVTTNIPWYQYSNDIKNIVIEEGITMIGKNAFRRCSNLEKLTLPKSVFYVGNSSFDGCTSIKDIYYADTYYKLKKLISDSNNDELFGATYHWTSTYDSGTSELCRWSFDRTKGELVFTGTGAMFNDYGYNTDRDDFTTPWHSYASEIKSVVISKGITEISKWAFKDCDNLTSISIPNSVKTIGDKAFSNCYKLSEITIPESVTSIGSNVFLNCLKLNNINLSNHLNNIGDDAFLYSGIYNNDDNWDNDILYVDNYLVATNKDIRNANIKENTAVIANQAFTGRPNLATVTIPKSIKSIGENTFAYCSNLQTVTLPDELTEIGDYAFSNCTSLKNINIPKNIKSIADETFEFCTSLQTITLPNGITDIGGYAFRGCTSLNNINLPSSIKCIKETAFYDTGYYNNSSNWDNGVLYIDKYLIKVKYNVQSLIIKDGTLAIAESAFNDDNGESQLTKVFIPSSMKFISNNVFQYCEHLNDVTISKGVQVIGEGAFHGCSSLVSIELPNSVTKISDGAFSYCDSLQTIIIPTSVKEIGKDILYYSDSIKNIYYRGTKDEWKSISIGYNDFYNITYNYGKKIIYAENLKLNKSSVSLYKGNSTVIKATVNPTDTTNKDLMWTTSNSKVATVNSQGKITAKGKGTAIINVITTDGSNKSATCKVTVKQLVTSVKLNKKSANLKVKGKANQKSVTLKATALPKDANNKAVNWSTSNKKIATVNSKGKVTAKKRGTCYIIATAKDGSKKSAKCKIVVK